MPRNPKLILNICSVVNRGLTTGPLTLEAIVLEAIIVFDRNQYVVFSDHKSVGQDGAFFNYHNSIFNSIECMVSVSKMGSAVDPNVIAYPTIFIDDSIADIASLSYAYFRQTPAGAARI